MGPKSSLSHLTPSLLGHRRRAGAWACALTSALALCALVPLSPIPAAAVPGCRGDLCNSGAILAPLEHLRGHHLFSLTSSHTQRQERGPGQEEGGGGASDATMLMHLRGDHLRQLTQTHSRAIAGPTAGSMDHLRGDHLKALTSTHSTKDDTNAGGGEKNRHHHVLPSPIRTGVAAVGHDGLEEAGRHREGLLSWGFLGEDISHDASLAHLRGSHLKQLTATHSSPEDADKVSALPKASQAGYGHPGMEALSHLRGDHLQQLAATHARSTATLSPSAMIDADGVAQKSFTVTQHGVADALSHLQGDHLRALAATHGALKGHSPSDVYHGATSESLGETSVSNAAVSHLGGDHLERLTATHSSALSASQAEEESHERAMHSLKGHALDQPMLSAKTGDVDQSVGVKWKGQPGSQGVPQELASGMYQGISKGIPEPLSRPPRDQLQALAAAHVQEEQGALSDPGYTNEVMRHLRGDHWMALVWTHVPTPLGVEAFLTNFLQQLS